MSSPSGSAADEAVGVDGGDGALDVAARQRRPAQADVVGDAAREEIHVLQHQAADAAQLGEVELADVDAVDEDAPALDVVEAQQQADDRGLAGAGRADDADPLPGRHLERDVAQHPVESRHRLGGIGRRRGVDAVGEPDVLEHDVAARAGRARPSARAGEAMVTGVSSSVKIRSDDAIAACSRLNFSDMSLIGRKKRCAYCRKATSAPRSACPVPTQPPPATMISAAASAATTSIAG